VRWAALAGKNLPVLMVQADDTNLQVSALPYTDEVMTPIEYSVDLPPSQSTVLTIATRTLGVGSASCGPRPEEQYLVWSEPAAFSYVLKLPPIGEKNFSKLAHSVMASGRLRPTFSAVEKKSGPVGKVIAADSFEPGEGDPSHAADGDLSTYWHTAWSSGESKPPHFIVVDYGHELELAGVIYTARVDGENGHVKDYEVYLSNDDKNWNAPVAKGTISRDADAETIKFKSPVHARYLKFIALNEQSGRAFATVAELEAIEASSSDLKTELRVAQ
jgi:beta-galactosidase